MALNPITPGLRTVRNRSHDVAKISIVVPAGDELVVSDYVASQLETLGAFRSPRVADRIEADPVEEAAPVEGAEGERPDDADTSGLPPAVEKPRKAKK